MILIYVDGTTVLMPEDCIYIPPFDKKDAVELVEGGNQLNGKAEYIIDRKLVL